MDYSERDCVWMAQSHSCGRTVLRVLRMDNYSNTASNILLVNVLICIIGSFLVLKKKFTSHEFKSQVDVDIRNMYNIVLYV